MARIDDGELFLEIEGATQEQLRAGLTGARQYIARSGVYVEDAMRSAAMRSQESEWATSGDVAEMTEEDEENADIVDEAWLAALQAADASAGTLGLLPAAERTRNRPVVRDLFEPVP